MNDIAIIIGIVFMFILIGAALPFMRTEFGIENERGGEDYELPQSLDEHTDYLTLWSVIWSVAKMFFWTFGSVPILIDLLIITPFRIVLLLTVARNVWVGGGG